VKHGHGIGFRKSRTASAWRNAKTRCFNKENENWGNYGGRGITMCPEWANDFRAFLRDMGECPGNLTLERIDVNGNYEPGNCKWIPRVKQAKNRRTNYRVQTDDGEVILIDFCRQLGVSYNSVHQRIRLRGETAHEAAEWLLAKKRLRS
jgi:hypothetical protein